MFVQRNNVRAIKTYFRDNLKDNFSQTEIKWIVRESVCRSLGLSFSEYLFSDNQLLSESELLYFRSIVKRLLAGEPFQYIISHSFFCGIDLYIAPGVLIPRPETEELVDWIENSFKNVPQLKVLDVCSGSGCIAFALEGVLNDAKVSALELSDEALTILEENKLKLNSAVKTIHADALTFDGWSLVEDDSLDIIISNPPYILMEESLQMNRTVLEHEPMMALFVSDNDPVVFYKSIINYGLPKLKRGGKFFFELNPISAMEVIELMEDHSLVNITLRKDLQGRDRMLMGQKP
jgi:release factor glutamine methyltransferase